MLSVFITPCTKPTRIQCAAMVAVRLDSPGPIFFDPSKSALCAVTAAHGDETLEALLQHAPQLGTEVRHAVVGDTGFEEPVGERGIAQARQFVHGRTHVVARRR